jgi:hypothetical protein
MITMFGFIFVAPESQKHGTTASFARGLRRAREDTENTEGKAKHGDEEDPGR